MPSGVYQRPPRTPKEMRAMCSAPGCNRRARSAKGQYCETHYYRLWRTGAVDLRPREIPEIIIDSAGYAQVYPPSGHPLECGYRIREHRLVMFDNCGFGPYVCHWCNKPLTWEAMEVDHVNGNKSENDIGNLVPSCGHCNRARGVPKMRAAHRARAIKLTYGGETLCVSEWAQRLGISSVSLYWRIERGWPLWRALTEGRGKTGPRASRG